MRVSSLVVNKASLVKKIITQLGAELALFAKAARAAHAEATHEQSKAENKYDTRGLEAAYLARGQSRQAAEIEQAIQQFESLPVRAFGPQDPIDLSAFVELESKAGQTCYFIGPRAGGMEIRQGQRDVLVLTPNSPLGQQLVGRRQGERLRLEFGGTRDDYRIVAVA